MHRSGSWRGVFRQSVAAFAALRGAWVGGGAPAVAWKGPAKVLTGMALSLGVGSVVLAEGAADFQAVSHEEQDVEATVERLLPMYRLRLRSSSSFRGLFNTLADVADNGDRYMTAKDFVRSVLYPQLYYDAADPLPDTHDLKLLNFLGDADGRIRLSEFVLLRTLLSVPDDHVEVAFNMFDTDDSGTLSPSEVLQVVRALTRRALEDAEEGEVATGEPPAILPQLDVLPSRLGVRLFGSSYTSPRSRESCSITPAKFKQFINELRRTELAIKFRYFARESLHGPAASSRPEGMTAFMFGRFLVAHCDPYWVELYLKRLTPLHSIDSVTFGFDSFVAFDFALAGYGDDIRDALQLFLVSQGTCTLGTFERAVKVAAGVALPRAITQTLFTIFNSNQDVSHVAVSDLHRVFALYATRKSKPSKSLTTEWPGLDGFVKCMKEDA